MTDIPSLVFVGDSITRGAYVPNGNQFAFLTASATEGKCIPNNIGKDGMYISEMAAEAAVKSKLYYRPLANNNTVVIAGGTNDISVGFTAGATYVHFKACCATWRAAGFKIVAVTILPMGAAVETQRLRYNALIRSDPTCYDFLADMGNDGTIGQSGQNLNETYYNTDHVHPVAAGHAIIARDYIIPSLKLSLQVRTAAVRGTFSPPNPTGYDKEPSAISMAGQAT